MSAQPILEKGNFLFSIENMGFLPKVQILYLTVFCICLYLRGMIYDGNETYYVQPFPGDLNRVSGI